MRYYKNRLTRKNIKMKFRNFPMVPRVIYGRGSFDQTSEIIEEKRNKDYPFIFLVDKVFEGKELEKRSP